MNHFDLLIKLYPPKFRVRFGKEMREVFQAKLVEPNASLAQEAIGLVAGALQIQSSRIPCQTSSAMTLGAAISLLLHVALYLILVPIASGQQSAQLDPRANAIAKSIYEESFKALRAAKSVDDLRKLEANLDAPEWIGVNRFGRTLMTRSDMDRGLESLLSLPPNPYQRITGMKILWTDIDVDRRDATGATHRLTRATLIRDTFQKTAGGWRRIQHQKLLPNDPVLAADGKPQIVPPLSEASQVR